MGGNRSEASKKIGKTGGGDENRGTMTITLRSGLKGGPDKSEKVKFHLANPEIVASRLVEKLSKQFPPESLVTVMASPREKQKIQNRDDESFSTSSENQSGQLARSARNTDAHSSSSRRGMGSSSAIVAQKVQQASMSVQLYFVSPELVIAVPVAPDQLEIRLEDGSEMAITEDDVLTVFYNQKGHVVGHKRLAEIDDGDLDMGMPAQKGVAWYVQQFLLSDELVEAIPIVPGQREVRTEDGPVEVTPDSIISVYYGGRGLGIFHRLPNDSVFPGAFNGDGMAFAAVPHLEVENKGGCIPISPLQRAVTHPNGRVWPVKPGNTFVAFYDNEGNAVAFRDPSGTLFAGAINMPGAATSIRYVYNPESDPDIMIPIPDLSKPLRIPGTGKEIEVAPEDVFIILEDENGNEIGMLHSETEERAMIALKENASVSSKRTRDSNSQRAIPLMGTRKSRTASSVSQRSVGARCIGVVASHKKSDMRSRTSSAGSAEAPPASFKAQPQMRSKDLLSSDLTRSKTAESRPRASSPQRASKSQSSKGDSQQQTIVSRGSNNGSEFRRPDVATEESVAAFIGQVNQQKQRSRKSGATDDANSSAGSAMVTAGSQSYHYLSDVNFAIPITEGQTYVKLADGQKRAVEPANVYVVEYDHRGLPRKTVGPEGSVPWALNKPGVGLKLQRYFVLPDLVFAVPIVPGQTSVVITNGAVLPVELKDVVTVFYDANGKSAFYYNGAVGSKIRPGGFARDGVASQVNFFSLMDSQTTDGLVTAIPISGYDTSVAIPGCAAPYVVNRDRIAITFHERATGLVAKFAQLEDGSLVYGGLGSSIQVLDKTTLSSMAVTELRMVSTSANTGCSTPALPPTEYRMTSTGDYEKVTYVEVPTEVEVVKHVTVKKTEIIERRVPKIEVQIVEKIIEVPEIVYVDKPVEIERIEYNTTVVKVKEIIEKPIEQIRYVPKIEVKTIEKVIEVPQIIEVPRLEIIERKVHVEKFHDKTQHAVVAQTVRPMIRQATDITEEVDCLQLEPTLIPVDVYVPKLVRSTLIPVGNAHQEHREVKIPHSHFNSLTIQMNPHFQSNFEKLPLIRASNGSIPMLPSDARLTVVHPSEEIVRDLLQKAELIRKGVEIPATIQEESGRAALVEGSVLESQYDEMQ